MGKVRDEESDFQIGTRRASSPPATMAKTLENLENLTIESRVQVYILIPYRSRYMT